MTAIAFYHLEASPLEAALPKLLSKTLDAGKRALVLAGSEEKVEALCAVLWTFDADAWLPHGTHKDGNPEDQPIWLAAHDDNPNGSDFLFLTDGATSENVGAYERCFEMFDGHDEMVVQAARERWKVYKDAGHDLAYWQQTASGGWEQKA